MPPALGTRSLTHWTTRNTVRSEVRIECKWTMEEIAAVEEELNEGTFIDTNEKRSSKKLSQSDAGKETLRHMS